MELEDSQTGERFEAVIELATRKDFNTIKKDTSRFDAFHWSKYAGKEIYKLRLTGEDKILGVMCIQDYPPEEGVNALEIVLLEVSAETRSTKKLPDKKRFLGIAGCLIAFACRESFKRGYNGWLFLIPKSYLIEHYTQAYGFRYIPLNTAARPDGFMELNTSTSIKLIKKYLG